MLAERFPVPVEGADANGVSLGFVFAVAALVLFGWAPGDVHLRDGADGGRADAAKPARSAPSSTQASSASSARSRAGSSRQVDARHERRRARSARSGSPRSSLYCVNLLLVTAAIAASGSELGYFKLIRSNVRWTMLPFALMASTALMLVVLWQRTPYLFAALAGPLVAISLYQRSTHRALNAMRLALTDPLTGLGNHRHFHERLQRELATAAEDDAARVAVLPRHRRLQADQRPVRPSRPATACSRRSRRGCARAARRSASAATSSRCSCRASTSRRRSTIARVDRRADRRVRRRRRAARSRSAPASRRSRSTAASATR